MTPLAVLRLQLWIAPRGPDDALPIALHARGVLETLRAHPTSKAATGALAWELHRGKTKISAARALFGGDRRADEEPGGAA